MERTRIQPELNINQIWGFIFCSEPSLRSVCMSMSIIISSLVFRSNFIFRIDQVWDITGTGCYPILILRLFITWLVENEVLSVALICSKRVFLDFYLNFTARISYHWTFNHILKSLQLAATNPQPPLCLVAAPNPQPQLCLGFSGCLL